MRTVSDAAREVLRLFHYGPHFTPEQNRALASLHAAVENEVATGETLYWKPPGGEIKGARRVAGRSPRGGHGS